MQNQNGKNESGFDEFKRGFIKGAKEAPGLYFQPLIWIWKKVFKSKKEKS